MANWWDSVSNGASWLWGGVTKAASDIGTNIGNEWNRGDYIPAVFDAVTSPLALPVATVNNWFDPVKPQVDNFLATNPVGQAAAPVLASGGGWSSESGTHLGTAAPTPAPVAGDLDFDGIVDSAVADYNRTNGGGTQYGNNFPGWPETMAANTPNMVLNPNQPSAQVNPAIQNPQSPATPGTISTGGQASTGTPDWLNNPAVMGGIGSVVGGAGSIIAGKVAADGAVAAGEAAAAGADKAGQLQKEMFDQLRTDQAPWRAAGEQALGKLQTFDAENPTFGMPQFQADPGYSFRLSEGMKALQNSAAARGMMRSGNTLKAISNYGQESASQEYQNAFNRYQTERGARLNGLQSLAGVGQTAVQQVGQAGQNYANNAGNAMVGGANALALGKQGAANANASGYMGAGNALTNALGNYQGQTMLNNLLGGK